MRLERNVLNMMQSHPEGNTLYENSKGIAKITDKVSENKP